VAEEIGIVPIHAIVHELARDGFARPAALVYWARERGGLVYDAQLAALARAHGRFAYHPVTAADGEPAVIAERLAGDVTGLVAYVAGGDATIKAARTALVAKGMERRAVKWEKFW
jgi:NAD(P)H-flavin reductase